MAENNLPQLPDQLIIDILDFSEPSDRPLLMRVSKVFQDALKPGIYQDIELHGSIDNANKCLATLSDTTNSSAELVQEFNFFLPVGDWSEDKDIARLQEETLTTRLSAALRRMTNVRKIGLHCPPYDEVWVALLSTRKDHLAFLKFHSCRTSPTNKLDCLDKKSPFNNQIEFPSLERLFIQTYSSSGHRHLIQSLLTKYAKQLRSISAIITDSNNIPNEECNQLIPEDIGFPRLQALRDLSAAQFGRHLSDRMPHLQVLEFSQHHFHMLRNPNEELLGHFKDLVCVSATYPVLRQLLSSPRPLEYVSMWMTCTDSMEDFRRIMDLLSNCSSSLLALHLVMPPTNDRKGVNMNELWPNMPHLPRLEEMSILVPDFCARSKDFFDTVSHFFAFDSYVN